MKENREEGMVMGEDFNGRIGEKGAKIGKRRRNRIQRQGEKCRGEETDGMDRRKMDGKC
jgi:hypothetical protein